jgi:hypothetical protein
MSKANTFENDLIALIFNGTTIANIAENATTAPLTNLFLSLHTADPGEAGTQSTSEANYTGYARAAVARNGAGWTISSGTATNAVLIQFPQCTAGTNTLTHIGIGTVLSGGGKLLYSGGLGSSLNVSAGIQPQLAIGTLSITED